MPLTSAYALNPVIDSAVKPYRRAFRRSRAQRLSGAILALSETAVASSLGLVTATKNRLIVMILSRDRAQRRPKKDVVCESCFKS